eukprot:749146-Hanusia_phi.AAC.1
MNLVWRGGPRWGVPAGDRRYCMKSTRGWGGDLPGVCVSDRYRFRTVSSDPTGDPARGTRPVAGPAGPQWTVRPGQSESDSVTVAGDGRRARGARLQYSPPGRSPKFSTYLQGFRSLATVRSVLSLAFRVDSVSLACSTVFRWDKLRSESSSHGGAPGPPGPAAGSSPREIPANTDTARRPGVQSHMIMVRGPTRPGVRVPGSSLRPGSGWQPSRCRRNGHRARPGYYRRVIGLSHW